MSFSNLYFKAPVFIQNIAVSLYGLYWKKRRFGGVFKKEVELFRSRNSFSKQQWYEYQEKELKKLLVHAFTNVPFYKKKYSDAGFSIKDFQNFRLKDLSKLPFLEKEELRQFGKTELLSNTRNKGDFYSSSGSTGTPTSIYYSREFHQKWSAAFEVRIREWAGVDRFTPRGMIGGRKILKSNTPPFYRHNYFEKQTYFSAYHIGPSNINSYLKGIIDGKVEYMTGYAMSNYLLAKEFEKAGIIPPKMKAIITSSETLTNEMRRTLEKVYDCKVFDSYSGVEACGLISESNDRKLLNSPDVGIIEVLDEKANNVKENEIGELISTGILNYDQPLIRYKIGDRISLGNVNNVNNQTQMPIIKSINGRIEDVVIGANGNIMVRFHSVFIDINGLIASQIIQQTISHIVLKLVIDDNCYNDVNSEAIMTDRLKYQLGDSIKIFFEYVNELPLTSSGKIKAVISKI
jgi:phenylacetate-CoA ligase